MSRLGQGPRYFLSLLEPFILGVLLHLDKYFEMLSTGLASSGAHMVYHEEVAAGDMPRVTCVSSALLWPSEHGIVAWSGDAQTNWGGWPLMCSDCFPRPESKNRSYVCLQFTIPQIRAKTTSKKVSGGREKDNVASCSVREYRIKIQVLWFRSISWRRWLFPCIINRRYWIDISRPAEIRFLIQLFIIHSLTELYTGQQPSHNCLLYPPLPGTPTETGVVRFNNPPVFKLHHPSFHPPSLFPYF